MDYKLNLSDFSNFDKISSLETGVSFNRLKEMPNFNPLESITDKIKEITMNVIESIDNYCRDFIEHYHISIDDWSKNAVRISYPDDDLLFFGNEEIKYKDVTICKFCKDPMCETGYIVSSSWKIYQEYTDSKMLNK